MKKISLASLVLLVGCAGNAPPANQIAAPFMQPPNPAVVKDIQTACLGSGFFKVALGVGGRIALGPAGDLPVSLIDAGVDKVCMNPEMFAADVSTAAWVVKNAGNKGATILRKM